MKRVVTKKKTKKIIPRSKRIKVAKKKHKNHLF